MNRGDKVKLIEIYLSDEQTHACSRNIFYAGRKYDDGAMAIKFVNEELFKAPGWKYYLKVLKDGILQEIPMMENLFIISTALTKEAGVYTCQIIARYNFGEKTKSFSEFKLEIEETIFDQEITEITIDPNILSLYEELLKLKEHLEKFTINFVTNSEIDEILEEVFEKRKKKNVN